MIEMDTNMSQEKLSALLDGELDSREVDALLAALQSDDSLLEEACAWQSASSVLRGEVANPDFMARFSKALAQEPVVIAPGRVSRRRLSTRWLLAPLAVAASVAFVGVAVWRVNPPAEQESLIALEADSSMYAYLAAHRESDGEPFIDTAAVHPKGNIQPAEYRR